MLTSVLILGLAGVCIGASDAVLIDLPQASSSASIYTWQQPSTGDWQSPENWAPARTNPAPNDVLIFNTATVTTATNVPTQTIGQLLVSGNITVNLQSAGPVTLTIAGGDGDDLTVAVNSALSFNGDNALVCNLSTGATAGIDGFVRFLSSTSAAHRLTAVDTGAVRFKSGAVFFAMQGFAGNPFGTTNLNSVIFENGSLYICAAGGDPFGAAEPSSVVIFEHGSLFSLEGNVTPSFTGRTYANFQVNHPGSNQIFASGAMSVDDLNFTAGGLAFYLSGDPGLSIKGNITLNGPGTHLDFMSGIYRLDGTTTQVISGFGSTGYSITRLIIDNPMGIILQRPFGAYDIDLVNGVVTTVGMVTLGSSGVVSRTNGYVNGYMSHTFSAPGSFVYHLGTENGYSPVTVNVTRLLNSLAGMTIGEFQTAQPNISDPSRALTRYWEIYAQNYPTADLTFHYLDPDIPATANEANFVIERYDGVGFMQPDFGFVDTAANSFHANGVTQFFRDWTLAEPGVIVSPTPTASPTPTSTPLTSVSGTIIYGNAIGAPEPRVVSNVTVTGLGPSHIFTTTIFPNGDYLLTDFQPGAYTVTPSKSGGVNGAITSFDAAKIAQHAAGVSTLTGNQLIVADVSGNGAITSFDAAQVARFAAGLGNSGATGNWIFMPANRSYASVTGNIAGEDFVALLMGEVSGNWMNTGARTLAR